jgi:hypothetical protein
MKVHSLFTPHDVSDFTRTVLLSAKGPVHLHLHPHQAELMITTHERSMPSCKARITCPQFAARLLPSLRAAFFRAQMNGQLLTCEAHWFRHQVHMHLLDGDEDIDYYFAYDLTLLDRDVALTNPNKTWGWPCTVLTFGSHHVHMHHAASLQRAKDGLYEQKPFISRLWLPKALALLKHELQRAKPLTQAWVVYDEDLFEPIRLYRKLQLLMAP